MNRKVSLLLAIFLFTLSWAQAQTKGDKYVFVISKVNYLKAIDDALAASEESGLNVEEIRVVLCGESVKAFQEHHPLIGKALKQDRIHLYACGLSLEQMKIDPSVLPDEVKTVRNGILEAMMLEKKGYIRFDL